MNTIFITAVERNTLHKPRSARRHAPRCATPGEARTLAFAMVDPVIHGVTANRGGLQPVHVSPERGRRAIARKVTA